MDADERRLNELTEAIIGCAFAVSNELGVGFLEKVYENAMLVELTQAGIKAQAQVPVKVRYRGVLVGEYLADLIIEGSVIVEIKHARCIDQSHVAQCLNYMKATGIRIGLVLNFGAGKVQIRRLIRSRH